MDPESSCSSDRINSGEVPLNSSNTVQSCSLDQISHPGPSGTEIITEIKYDRDTDPKQIFNLNCYANHFDKPQDEAISGKLKHWLPAIRSELDLILKPEVWEIVPKTNGIKSVLTKWIFTNTQSMTNGCEMQ